MAKKHTVNPNSSAVGNTPTPAHILPGRNIGNVATAAERYSLSRSYFYHGVLSKTIPHFKVGTAVRFDFDQLDAWFDSHAVEPLTTNRAE